MRVFVAMLSHETNTFSTLATDRAQFEKRELRYGGKVRKSYVKSAKMVWAVLAIAAGLFLTFGGFMAGL